MLTAVIGCRGDSGPEVEALEGARGDDTCSLVNEAGGYMVTFQIVMNEGLEEDIASEVELICRDTVERNEEVNNFYTRPEYEREAEKCWRANEESGTIELISGAKSEDCAQWLGIWEELEELAIVCVIANREDGVLLRAGERAFEDSYVVREIVRSLSEDDTGAQLYFADAYGNLDSGYGAY
jgi:hypothetical protein